MRPFNLTRIQEVVARLRWSVSHGHPRSRTFRFIGLAKRKYLAGHEERKKKRFEEEKRQEDKGALLKYMIGKGSQVPVNTAPTVGPPATSTSGAEVVMSPKKLIMLVHQPPPLPLPLSLVSSKKALTMPVFICLLKWRAVPTCLPPHLALQFLLLQWIQLTGHQSINFLYFAMTYDQNSDTFCHCVTYGWNYSEIKLFPFLLGDPPWNH
ncbi:uncharacterized protein LOC121901412 isoform X2 [Thunnus maccoyii]|uniref:uncharacterized protein LOC121901412 isoform X2 n=1 Tax=Thunnus maccoyii TaxID=8240 RepID=UPI001C4D45B3|nr:uncharacterized protein LOC121901412 isoform X2 [Thunnus maccoyii]